LNSILLEEAECTALPDQASALFTWSLRREDRRARHLLEVLKLAPGREFHLGVIDHSIGRGVCTIVDQDAIHGTYAPTRSVATDTRLTSSPRRSLVLGLPRPKSLRRVLRMVGNLGVHELHLINTARVDKSYWGSPWLESEALRAALIEGLEIACRAGATLPVLPKVHQHRLFRPFAEDQLPELLHTTSNPSDSAEVRNGVSGIVLHPGPIRSEQERRLQSSKDLLIALGPEGGFVDFELELFQKAGLEAWSFGERCWSVEVAVPYAMAYFSPT